jgi:hypothetical protein
MKPPTKASSVWPEMPFMRGPVGAQRLREWLPVQRQIRENTAKRRERVLAHEWARKRLRAILHIERSEQWNGFIPPATDQHGHCHRNPVRDALIELCKDVVQAEEDGPRPPIHVGDITPTAPELELVE